MILAISHEKDEHAKAVLAALKQLSANALLLDLSDFPQHYKLEVRYDGGSARSYRLNGDDSSIDLNACGAIWWRRPQPFVLHTELQDPVFYSFAWTEATEAFTGLWPSLEAVWINPPSADANAHRKLYQLRIAQDVGLAIPETLITSDPGAALAFVRAHGIGHTIYKAFSGTREAWRETRLVKKEELDSIDAVRYAPVIFQRYIEATLDLRVTVIGDAVFPAAIYSQESAYPIDFRMDMAKTRIEPYEMPKPVCELVRTLLKRLGLVYGAIDMRLTPEGNYVFLEVNPAGQWLFIEGQSGQPITATLAAALSQGDASREHATRKRIGRGKRKRSQLG